ncbi:MAG: sigma-70 family RNA polymerase sigma factor [Chloroflexi bacterium]|nr:sigma-70 family RNA polymerase sigma factor [Chloroflexota bacterium]
MADKGDQAEDGLPDGDDDHIHPDAEPVTASSAPLPPARPAGSPLANGDDARHECANCFALFSWDPMAVHGEAYCCAGCADGGPCFCTYEGPSQTAPEPERPAEEPAPTPAAEEDEPELETETEPALVAAQAPEMQQDLGPSRHDVLLAAIAEFPVDLRAVATLRVTRDVSVREIAVELGLDEQSAVSRLEQGRAILTRAVGPDYSLEYTDLTESRR